MALYDIEIIETPKSAKAKKLICSLSGISEREIEDRLQFLPLAVKGSLLLSEAISIERDLKRLGVTTRLVKVGQETEEYEEVESSETESVEAVPVEIAGSDIIEIPEDDIKVLHPYKSIDQASGFKRKRIATGNRWRTWTALITFLMIAALISWYVIAQSRQHQQIIDIEIHITQWENTLQQQDILLERGFPPERIFYKLDELEGTIERMLSMVKQPGKVTELRSKFVIIKSENRDLIGDLAFRYALVENGYPIHPTCLVDRGMVQGSSELPESTLLRVKLYGQINTESNYYPVRLSGGTFRLIIDPSIERDVFDASATVASLSQQPDDIKRWAERKFQIADRVSEYMPRTARIPIVLDEKASSNSPVIDDQISQKKPVKGGIDLGDPGNDISRSGEIDKTLTVWRETIISSQRHNLTAASPLLEEIYLRLLDLEVRINQLIGLFESSVEQNIWIEKREEVFGEYIGIRQEISSLYDSRPKDSNPFKMESRIRDFFHSEGLLDTEVLVVDSPRRQNAFVIEIDITEGEKEVVFISTAKIIANEMKRSRLEIDHISLHYAGKTLRWTPDHILSAAELMIQPEGLRRCVTLLDISAFDQTLP